MDSALKIHPFEERGLGIAPFRYAGYARHAFKPAPDVPAMPGDSCDYCGTGIMDVFYVKSSDGKKFKVGCNCIEKTYRECDTTTPPDFRKLKAAMEREKRAERRQAKYEALMRRVRAAQALLDAAPDLLASRPHPYEQHAARGLTRRDYLVYLLRNGGDATRAAACREIESASATPAPSSQADNGIGIRHHRAPVVAEASALPATEETR